MNKGSNQLALSSREQSVFGWVNIAKGNFGETLQRWVKVRIIQFSCFDTSQRETETGLHGHQLSKVNQSFYLKVERDYLCSGKMITFAKITQR